MALRATRPLMGAAPRFEYPKQVWSPSGGWWCNPRHWERNTKVAYAAVGVAVASIWTFSAANERRPMAPVRHIPSQLWCSHAEEDDPTLEKGWGRKATDPKH